MRRLQAGVGRKGEWMAPDEVVEGVRGDYLAAMRWLQEHGLAPWQYRWRVAPTYLSGPYLRRFQAILTQQDRKGAPAVAGVLRADHQLTVRHFSEDGETCLVVDQQTQRRMATYDRRTQDRVTTQDLGDGALVFRMRYDGVERRWKIDDFVQELPQGWGQHATTRRIRELPALPTVLGRDH